MSQDKDKNIMLKPGTAAELSGGNKDYNHDETNGIDQSLLEKRLEGLRDTQESVQGLSLWCQANKRHSSAIIETWLKILKKSPVEKRLTLFYLANDVVQHAKRKSDAPVVNQWAFAVQKATPQVRSPSSVSSAISRIFRIWEERGVYSKETIADLMALLNNVPAKERVGEKKKPETYTASADKVQAFQPANLISKVKLAYRLKSHLGVTFRAKTLVNMDLENLKASIKDRSHGMEVIQEIGQLVEQLKASETKLQTEVEERRKIVETAEIAIVHYENVRGEAKIVNSAYKNFTERVEATRDKVLEKMKSFEEMEIDSSPVPSPPPEAPSPPPDEDDFGVKPWSNQSYNSTLNNSRIEIMEAIKSHMSPKADASSNSVSYNNNSHSSYISVTNSNQQQTTLQQQNSTQQQYDPSIPSSLAVMQQQFQNAWGNSNAENYAAMSAMIQQMLPQGANNYLQTSLPQPQTGGGGYNTYQQPPPTQQATVPDVSSIPLPPSSTTEPSVGSVPDMSSPPVTNPYLTPYSYDSTKTNDANEYVPAPYYKQDFNSSVNYGSTDYYQPYQNNRRQSETSNSSSQANNSMLVSPTFSNHSGSESRFYNSGNNSSEISPSTAGGFDPMEMFASALSKNKNCSAQPSQEINSDGAINNTPNQGFNHFDPSSSSFYAGGAAAMYDSSFDESHNSSTNGDGETYSPRKPGMGNFFNSRGSGGRGNNTSRGNFNNNRPPRGRGIGGPPQRGFAGGFRGRGAPRGTRGGRSRF